MQADVDSLPRSGPTASPDGTCQKAGLEASSATDRNGIQVIARAAAVLRAVARTRRGMTLSELATDLQLARSTVQRIVGALVEEELLVSAGTRAGVMLGPSLLRLAAAAVTDTERLVRPVLEALSRDTGETVDLSVLQADRAVFVDQVIGTARLVASSAIGASFPLYPTANGKALLARLPRHRRGALIPAVLDRHTPATITDHAALAAAIDAAEVSGVAFDLEEHAEGICAIGAAFTNKIGRDFAVSIPVPSGRFEAKRAMLERTLRDAMATIAGLDP